MKIIKNLFLLIALISSVSCVKHENGKAEDFELVSTLDVKFDLVFPQELWDYILTQAPPSVPTDKSAYDIFESLPMQVELLDSPKEVLGGKNFRFDFKEFGGEIDFNAYLKRDVVGSFKMNFNFQPAEEGSVMRVFYMSWSKQYSRDDEVFGNGCGYFYDVTSYFKKEVFKNGLKLHTNNYRYFDLMAGRLYFVNYTKYKIQIAQLTLTDTSLEKRMCEDRI
jgi:hypothetical protein